ncbi:hypothetical protein [Actinokineospora globicatena]|uniref:Uncharacterized protein n=1 Tax=Actinokineospora globicatena TaxID=103729 RepID=A0A9W6V943_9PSEU|nr:hypothetical protein [Actinokineospora globicatena]GLW90588.1 hypothetical protein Aglo03_14040 [Actinokineospora globicatena]
MNQPVGAWDKPLVSTLRESKQENGLSSEIEPLFNDIADRKRGLFVEDFLIKADAKDKRCGSVDIDIPQVVLWSTEGLDMRAVPGFLDCALEPVVDVPHLGRTPVPAHRVPLLRA